MTQNGPIRVMVLADSVSMRANLQAVIEAEPAFEFMQSAAASRVLDDGVEGSLSDVWVLDMESGANEAALFRASVERNVQAMVLLIDEPDTDLVQEALRGDTTAILTRDATPVEIVAAIEAVAAGLFVLSPAVLSKLLSDPTPSRPPTRNAQIEALTAREIEVLVMLAEGLGNKEIARQLEISDNTVKFHLSSIFGKLGATSRTEAVMLGMRRGLIML